MISGRRHSGFTLLAAMLMVAALGAALAVGGPIWSQERQRQKEAELVWIGNQFELAIGLYYQRTPGTAKRFPEKLEDLLEDRRYVSIQRYLRKVYPDPMTGKQEWGLIPAPGGGIMGVHSLSEAVPIRRNDDARRYADWIFVYTPPEYGQALEMKPAVKSR